MWKLIKGFGFVGDTLFVLVHPQHYALYVFSQ